jgi:hypothetical protein
MNKLLILRNKSDRDRLAKILTERGVKVNHDSGGRALVVDVPEDSKSLNNLPEGVRVEDMKTGASALPRANQNERIFLEALSLRQTANFTRTLNRFKPGESPEEKQLLEAPHFFDEELGDWQ